MTIRNLREQAVGCVWLLAVVAFMLAIALTVCWCVQ